MSWQRLIAPHRRPRTLKILTDVYLRLIERDNACSKVYVHASAFCSLGIGVHTKSQYSSASTHARYTYQLISTFVASLNGPLQEHGYTVDCVEAIGKNSLVKKSGQER